MINVAVLDDYQNVFEEFIDKNKYKDHYAFTVFNDPFQNEEEIISTLKDFEVLFIMRERTQFKTSYLIYQN